VPPVRGEHQGPRNVRARRRWQVETPTDGVEWGSRGSLVCSLVPGSGSNAEVTTAEEPTETPRGRRRRVSGSHSTRLHDRVPATTSQRRLIDANLALVVEHQVPVAKPELERTKTSGLPFSRNEAVAVHSSGCRSLYTAGPRCIAHKLSLLYLHPSRTATSLT
jgi:hypothetical protein